MRQLNIDLGRQVEARTSELVERTAQLRALAAELTLSEQRERQRMARIVHDHLQQMLAGARFHVTILGHHPDPIVQKATQEIEQLIDDCIETARSLTCELSPPILHDSGLNAALEWLARWMRDTHGLSVDLVGEEDSAPLADDVRILLFESVRKLLFNVVKHSGTRSAVVNLRHVDSQLQVVVSDRGTDLDPKAIPPDEKGGGFGLIGVRGRLELLGGRLEIESAPGKGSRFVLTAPVGTPPDQPSELT